MSLDSSYKKIIEGLLFIAEQPLSEEALAEMLHIDRVNIRDLLSDLMAEYGANRHGFVLREVGGGYRFYAGEEASAYARAHLKPRVQKLSAAALETLAIVAYRQPVTRGEMEHIRGVNSDGALRTLLEYQLVEECGRKEAPGRPVLFQTTDYFLEAFGLNALGELPEPCAMPSEHISISDDGSEEYPCQEE